MKTAHELANQIMQPSCDDLPTEKEPLDERIVNRVFAVLAAQYGNRWTSLIQNEDADIATRKVWGSTLHGVDPLVIRDVLSKLPTEYPNWPPTVGQFLELCKVGLDPSMQPALPKPSGDEKLALSSLAEAKRILKV